MEFLVQFTVTVPTGTPESEVRERTTAEATAAAELVREGHLVRLWSPPAAEGETTILGLYQADDQSQLEALLSALPLYPWMAILITALGAHPNDPGADRRAGTRSVHRAERGVPQPG